MTTAIFMALRSVCLEEARLLHVEDNYCEIDPTTVDKYGIPVLRFHYKWSDYEVKQAST